MALGSCSTAASCSRLVDENGLASSTGGRGRASTWQLQLSYRAVRASTDEQRTGYALGVAIVQTAQWRSDGVRSFEPVYVYRLAVRLSSRSLETNPVPCQGAVEGYFIPRKSAVPPTPPNATQARAQALLSFVVYLSGQLTSFRCSSCAPCYIVSLSCLFLRQMPGMHR